MTAYRPVSLDLQHAFDSSWIPGLNGIDRSIVSGIINMSSMHSTGCEINGGMEDMYSPCTLTHRLRREKEM